MNSLNSGAHTAVLALLRWMNYRNGSGWTHFDQKGAIVSYNGFHYNARHSRAQYHDGAKASGR